MMSLGAPLSKESSSIARVALEKIQNSKLNSELFLSGQLRAARVVSTPFYPMPEDRKSPEARQQMSEIERLRHSCAHILATAILRIWPEAQFAAGPPVENGFYYDLEMDHHLSPADFDKIEAEMKKVVKENQPFEKIVVARQEAFELANEGRLGALGPRPSPSKFKLDILQGIPPGEE